MRDQRNNELAEKQKEDESKSIKRASLFDVDESDTNRPNYTDKGNPS